MNSTFKNIPKWQKHLLSILFLLIISYSIFLPTLRYDFVADDVELITERESFLQNPGSVIDIFTKPFFVETRDQLPYYRPIINLSYIMDYRIWGLNPFGFHLTNLLIHSLNTLLLYILSLQLTHKMRVAFGTAFLFALHPAHTGTVAWISGRTDSIAALFLLLSLVFAIQFIRLQKRGAKTLFGIFSSIFFLLGLFSKEIVIIFPLLLGIWLFLKNRKKWKKEMINLLILLGIPILFYFFVRFKVLGFLSSKVPAKYPLNVRILTLPTLFFSYLKKLIIPTEFNFATQISTILSVLNPIFWLYLILLILFFVILFYFRNSNPNISFGWTWIFIALLPILNLIPIASFYSEYWLYIPSIGFCLAISCIIFNLLPKKWLSIIFIFLIGIYYGFVTLNSISLFKDSYTLWKKTVENAPNFAIAHNQLGVCYLEKQEFDEAEREFLRCIEISPTYGDAYANLATIYMKKGEYQRALELVQKGASYPSLYATSDFQLIWGVCHFELKNYEEAIYHFGNSLQSDPNNFSALKGLGHSYLAVGNKELGKHYLKKAIELKGNSQNPDEILQIIESFYKEYADTLEKN